MCKMFHLLARAAIIYLLPFCHASSIINCIFGIDGISWPPIPVNSTNLLLFYQKGFWICQMVYVRTSILQSQATGILTTLSVADFSSLFPIHTNFAYT